MSDELVVQHRAFACSRALRFLPFRGYLEAEDLMQEASVGMLLAARRFDPERGYKFLTCAVHWCDREVSRAVSSSGPVHVPQHHRYGTNG